MTKIYQPQPETLNKYAQVLVNYALNSGEGVKPGEVVQIAVPDVSKDLARQIRNEVLKAGAHPMLRLLPTGMNKDFYDLANDDQLSFFPKQYLKAKVKLLDHSIGIIADPYPEELKEVPPTKILAQKRSMKPYYDWMFDKEDQGNFTWTIALWGVPAKAKEVGLSLKAYWDQIIKACYLDEDDPVAKWREIANLQTNIKRYLNSLEIDYLQMVGDDMDIKIGLGVDRVWRGGEGRNIPSFEIFTSPDWRQVEGWIYFNQEIYRYGNKISGVKFEIKQGRIVSFQAKVGQSLLKEILKTKNADKIGEISLTDNRMSRITHPMAEVLYDENMGGPFGNTHLAIGKAYKNCYRHDVTKLSKKQWNDLGYNDSVEHIDFVSTTDRQVTAKLKNGESVLIYQNGQFCNQ